MGKWSFLGNLNYRRPVINPIHQTFFFWLLKITFGNDFWTSKCLLQLARMARCDFLCTLFTACISHPSPNSSNGPDKREYYFVNCLFAVLCILCVKMKKNPVWGKHIAPQQKKLLSVLSRSLINTILSISITFCLVIDQCSITKSVNSPFTQWRHLTKFNQNPSGFCFLVQIKAFVISTSLWLPN